VKLSILTALAVVFMATAAHGQNLGFRQIQFETLDLRAGEMIIDRAGNTINLVGDADIVLRSSDPNEGNIRLRASTVLINLASSETNEIRSMTMQNRVIVEHPDGTVRADRGEWDVQSGGLVFTGNPIVNSPMLKEVQGDRIEINLDTGEARVVNPKVSGIQFKAGNGERSQNPFHLSLASIVDWPLLIRTLQDQHASEAESPGKRILNLVDPQVRAALPNLDPSKEPVPEIKSAVVDQLNRVLGQSTFYTAEAWDGISITPEAQALLDKGYSVLTDSQVVELNRRLLEAAYPQAIAPAAVE
jgi:lipopolysaccharide export system protein LptA